MEGEAAPAPNHAPYKAPKAVSDSMQDCYDGRAADRVTCNMTENTVRATDTIAHMASSRLKVMQDCPRFVGDVPTAQAEANEISQARSAPVVNLVLQATVLILLCSVQHTCGHQVTPITRGEDMEIEIEACTHEVTSESMAPPWLAYQVLDAPDHSAPH